MTRVLVAARREFAAWRRARMIRMPSDEASALRSLRARQQWRGL